MSDNTISSTSAVGGSDPWDLVRRAARDDAVVRPAATTPRKTCTISEDALGWVNESQVRLSPEAIANLSRPTPHSIGLAARAAADSHIDLRASLAQAHAASVDDTKTYVDAYIAYTATKPELAPLHARAVADGPELLSERQELEDERQIQALERAVGELQAQDKAHLLEVRPPLGGMQLLQAIEVGRVAVDITEFTLAIAVPEVGVGLSILEAAAGRTLSGRELSVDERVLSMALAVAPAAGKIIGAGARGAEAVAQIARQTGRSGPQIVALLRELQTIGRQEKLLKEAMDLQKAGRPLLPIHEAALNRTVKQLCRGQGLAWSGEKVVLRDGGALPPLREPIPASITAKLTMQQRGILEVYLRRLEQTSFATRKDCAIFYSGRVAGKPAYEAANDAVAASGGKKQVISDVGGAFFNDQNMGTKLSREAERLIWVRASAKYAEAASGDIQVIGDVASIRSDSIFVETELPRLLKNPRISESSRRELERLDHELNNRTGK